MTITITIKMFLLVYLAFGATQYNKHKEDLQAIANSNQYRVIRFLSFWFLMISTWLIEPILDLFLWVKSGFKPDTENED